MPWPIKKYFLLLKNKWWGGILVYGLIAISTYSSVWTLFESMNIQPKFNLFAYTIDRSLLLLVITIIVASHLTLLLILIHRWRLSSKDRNFAPRNVIRSLKVLDDADRYLSNVAHQIRLAARPYRRQNSLSVSKLFEIWSSRYDTNLLKLKEADFQELVIRLQEQKRLAGVILQGENIFADEEYYTFKNTLATESKKQISKKAVSLIKSGDVVILDSGSTTIHIARQISLGLRMRCWNRLTVITNFFKVADELLTAANEMGLEDDNTLIRVYVVGGCIRASTLALIGDDCISKDHTVNDFNSILSTLGGADLAFVGTNGIFLDVGFTTTSMDETNTKQAMLKWAKRKLIVADPSKFGIKQENVFATFDQSIEIITTNKGVEKHILDEYEQGLKNTSTRIFYA